jgi:hypothetical protein
MRNTYSVLLLGSAEGKEQTASDAYGWIDAVGLHPLKDEVNRNNFYKSGSYIKGKTQHTYYKHELFNAVHRNNRSIFW